MIILKALRCLLNLFWFRLRSVLASQNKYIRYQNDEIQSWKWNFLNWNIHSLIPQNDDEIS